MTLILLDRPTLPVDDATRRQFLIGGASLAALLAGCGNSTDREQAATGSAGFPRTLKGKEGPTTIPAEPSRVVAVGFQRDTDTAIALGVTPVAMSENSAIFPSGVAPWVEAALTASTPPLLDTAEAMPFEQIAALRPDLILATDDYALADNFAKLTGIAPTLSYLEGPEADTWQQRTVHIGRALGRERQAQQAIDDVEALVQRTARANPGFAGRTFSRGYVDGGQIRAVTGDVSQTLFEQLGLRLAPAFAALPQGDTPGRSVVSPENLGVFEADVMLVSYVADDDRSFLESNPLFQQLDVVRDGGYIRTEQRVSAALAFPSVLSIPYGLERTVAAIAAVLD